MSAVMDRKIKGFYEQGFHNHIAVSLIFVIINIILSIGKQFFSLSPVITKLLRIFTCLINLLRACELTCTKLSRSVWKLNCAKNPFQTFRFDTLSPVLPVETDNILHWLSNSNFVVTYSFTRVNKKILWSCSLCLVVIFQYCSIFVFLEYVID